MASSEQHALTNLMTDATVRTAHRHDRSEGSSWWPSYNYCLRPPGSHCDPPSPHESYPLTLVLRLFSRDSVNYVLFIAG